MSLQGLEDELAIILARSVVARTRQRTKRFLSESHFTILGQDLGLGCDKRHTEVHTNGKVGFSPGLGS